MATAVAFAYPSSSPLVPEHAGDESQWAWLYLGAMVAAFAAYLAGLYLLSRASGRSLRKAVVALACAIQLVPLAGPVMLSTDVYTYWDYARISTEYGGNPYVDEPADYPADVAYPLMGSRWYETTSVYGPGFTLASEAHASVVGASADAAAWLYRGLAAAAMVALVLLAARLSSRPAFAAAFVGWNPLLAVHFAGGGHNDAWMMAFVLAALALAASGRTVLAGVSWALAIAIKWVPLLFLPLRYLEARKTGRRVDHWGLAAGVGVIVAIATIQYGFSWLGAAGPLATNLAERSREVRDPDQDRVTGPARRRGCDRLRAHVRRCLRLASPRGLARVGETRAHRGHPARLHLVARSLVRGVGRSAGGGRGRPDGAGARPRPVGLSHPRRRADLGPRREPCLVRAPSRCGGLRYAVVGALISVAEAQRLVLDRAKPLEAERVPIERAAGRVLAEPAAASGRSPPVRQLGDGRLCGSLRGYRGGARNSADCRADRRRESGSTTAGGG